MKPFEWLLTHTEHVVPVAGVATGATIAVVSESGAGPPNSIWDYRHVGSAAGAVLAILAIIYPQLRKLMKVVLETRDTSAEALARRQRIQEMENASHAESMENVLRHLRHMENAFELRDDVGDKVTALLSEVGSMKAQEKIHYEAIIKDFNGLSARIARELSVFEKRFAILEHYVLPKDSVTKESAPP